MSTPDAPVTAVFADRVNVKRVVGWALWDWGSSAFNALASTFVFATYLAKGVATTNAPDGALSGAFWLGVGSACGGVLIALLAPVLGSRADAGGHRKRNLGIFTALTVLTMCAMFFVQQDYSFLFLGIALINIGSIFSEIGGVSYNAMLSQVATPGTSGRISGLGWASGYVGGIVLLLICFVGLISPEVGWFGVTKDNGLNVRVTMLVAAAWFAVSAIPLFLVVPEVPRSADQTKLGILGSYRKLVRDVIDLWHTDRNAVRFLIASALYRDGLAAVFTFGAVLAATVWGLTASQVIIFGIAANVVAAIGAALGGLFDDKIGPRKIVMISLVGLVASATVLFFVESTNGFWVFGLALTLFVGPAQSSSRVILSKVAPPGQEGQMFGLYATTGRAVSFLAPALFAVFTGISGQDRTGILAIALVLAVGLVALLFVKPPAKGQSADAVEQVSAPG